jgi:hypothetical protein
MAHQILLSPIGRSRTYPRYVATQLAPCQSMGDYGKAKTLFCWLWAFAHDLIRRKSLYSPQNLLLQ